MRRLLRAALLPLLLAAAPAQAEAPLDRVLSDLRRAGFGEVTVTATLLGRMRVVAESGEGSREIVLNPRTGEILRDLWTPRRGGDGAIKGAGGGQQGGGDDHDDDDDDDADDDDGDDDGGRGRGRGRGGDDD